MEQKGDMEQKNKKILRGIVFSKTKTDQIVQGGGSSTLKIRLEEMPKILATWRCDRPSIPFIFRNSSFLCNLGKLFT